MSRSLARDYGCGGSDEYVSFYSGVFFRYPRYFYFPSTINGDNTTILLHFTNIPVIFTSQVKLTGIFL